VQLLGPDAAPVLENILRDSYKHAAAYTMPMGMNYICEFLHHYEPDPWENHRGAGISAQGIGIDRTVATGSGYLGLYPPELAERYADPATCPLNVLLYFHHLPWTHLLPGGNTLLQELYNSYCDGPEAIRSYREQWQSLLGLIDLDRWAHVYEKFGLQLQHAERWRDLICRFFEELTGIPDARDRFSAPSPHNRIRSGFELAFEDYKARVQRERQKIS
jgi:alpha-glucuronidase